MIWLLFSFLGGQLLEPAHPNCRHAGHLGKNKIKVTVVTILASETPGPIDKPLQNIAKEIQRYKKELKSFRLKSMKCRSLEINKTATFKLVEKQIVMIIVKQTADEKNRVVLAVKPPKQNEFQYRTVCGKFLPIVTRFHTKTGQRLIVAIRVQPCRDE